MSNLTKCVECGQTVSKMAQTCPQCKSHNVHGTTCAICQVDGIKQSEVTSQSRITFHKDCYNEVINSFSEKAPFVHTCEACSGQNPINFVKSRFVFDLSDYFGYSSTINDEKYQWNFPCKRCGHPNKIILNGRIYCPYAVCECCKLMLNIDDCVVLLDNIVEKREKNSYGLEYNILVREGLYAHKLCYQAPKNKARLDEMVRVSEEKATQLNRESEQRSKEIAKSEFWREFESGGIIGRLGATLIGLLLIKTGIWLLQLLGIIVVIAILYDLYRLIKAISNMF